MSRATLYSTTYCSYCRAAKSFLTAKGVPIDEIDVTDDDEARADLAQRTGRHTVPQIWIGDTYVGGYDDLRALDRAGGLASLIAG